MKKDRRLEGEISSLNDERGFGFIVADGEERFFHRTALLDGLRIDALQPGDKVSFVPMQTPKGARAVKVRKVL